MRRSRDAHPLLLAPLCAALGVLGSAVFGSGCCKTELRDPGAVEVARGAPMRLLHPRTFGAAVALEQLVEARHGDELHTLHAQVEIDAERLVLVGLTPFGSRAFTLTFDGETLAVENLTARDTPFDPAFVLADLQMVLWPEPPPVPGCTWRTTGDERVLLREGDPVIRIGRGPFPFAVPMTLEHLERGYSLRIETIAAEALAAGPPGAAGDAARPAR